MTSTLMWEQLIDEDFLRNAGLSDSLINDIKTETTFPLSVDKLASIVARQELIKCFNKCYNPVLREQFMLKLKIHNSQGVVNSFNVANSSVILYSNNVTDSHRVYRSKYVENSERIYDCGAIECSTWIEKSHDIAFSNYVYLSKDIVSSRMIQSCENVTTSTMLLECADSKSCCFSKSLFFCEDVILSSDLTRCKNKILCNGLTDNDEYMILNQKVSEKIFNHIKEELLLTLSIESESQFNYYKKNSYLFLHGLNDKMFWKSIYELFPFEMDNDKILLTHKITYCPMCIV